MSDNHEDRLAAGRSWVNFYGDYELDYWSAKFGVSDERLKKIVEKFGVRSPEMESGLKP